MLNKDAGLDKLKDAVIESIRLSKLTNKELVEECLNSTVADHDIVCEMMNRLSPDWFKIIEVKED